ncbi:lipopolysaccharide biosynthesis protein [Methylomonas methanica]|uniref:Polysaccharide biosynthesis protein n=1 Tax=Methylomonas methanica (strain DSM 25384 / MC09) TaxID=857087 RepID=G0A362_METMM|nr:oligosaccharide flippase family protein [Methylomonas methanica]AEF98994.1 polysaccharide biosynthesis protein [Methylomonas methanica MC09]
MNPNFSVHPNHVNSLAMFGLSLSSYGLMYWVNIFLARHLKIGEFDDYSVAVSVVTLLSTLATLGLEKYALRMVSLNIEREKWGRLRNFLRFSVRIIVVFSVILLGTLSLTLEAILAWRHADFHIAIVIYAAFLPVIAISLFLIEIVTVYGFQVLAMFLYRLFLPVSFAALLFSLQGLGFAISATSAVICFGLAWCLTLLMLDFAQRFASPKPLRQAKPSSHNKRKWLGNALPLMLSSLMMTVLTSAGTIVLELLYPSEFQVGLFAVSMQTCSLISLIGTSTNRYYLPMLVVLVERQDATGVNQLLVKRLRLVALLTLFYLIVIGIYGTEILALFGPDFSEAYPALCICSAGAAINALFSDSPYYLQFMGQNRLVVGLMSLGAAGMVGLSFILGAMYGVTGVAIAYAVPAITLFSLFKFLARRHLKRYLSVNAPE